MKGLRFKKFSGSVEFFYTELRRDGRSYTIHKIVPTSISKEGQKPILKYALGEISKAQEGWRKREALEDEIRDNNIPIQATYKDGTPLEGRIIKATSHYIGVELDKPLKGSSDINFGFGSAMHGRHVFEADPKISQYGFDAASKALCSAYERALNKPTADLVGLLNQTAQRG